MGRNIAIIFRRCVMSQLDQRRPTHIYRPKNYDRQCIRTEIECEINEKLESV